MTTTIDVNIAELAELRNELAEAREREATVRAIAEELGRRLAAARAKLARYEALDPEREAYE